MTNNISNIIVISLLVCSAGIITYVFMHREFQSWCKQFKKESEFRKIGQKLKEQGYECSYDVKKKIIEFTPYTDVKTKIQWGGLWDEDNEIRVETEPVKDLDKLAREKYKEDISKMVYKICRGIKLEKFWHFLTIIGAICGIISLIGVVLISLG